MLVTDTLSHPSQLKRISQRPVLLIVDDELANRQKLKRTFLGEFEIVEAETGEQALEILENREVVVIITDQRMPGMSGVEFLKASLNHRPDTIRIILTGFTEIEDLLDAINLGQVDRYITKPWEPLELRQVVKREMERLTLKVENQRMAHELEIAKEVQERLFPQTVPRLRHLECYGDCRTAIGVGGDYYDFLQLGPEHLYLAVGDISGKGISAALLMASLQALFRSYAPLRREEVATLAKDLNRQLCISTQDNKFATFFCGFYDDRTRDLTYVNAGHNPPLLFSRDATLSSTRFCAGGMALGLFEDSTYSQETVHLEAGDLLVLYTDGVTEAEDGNDEVFGEGRLETFLSGLRSQSPAEIGESIIGEVTRFSGEQFYRDDVTLVVAKAR